MERYQYRCYSRARGLVTKTILIRGARQLLTLRGSRNPRRGADLGELGIIQDGSLLIRDGVIAEVGPTRRVENLAEARGAIEVNAAGRVVMPGLVDAHTHLVFPPPGAGDEDLAAAGRLVRGVNAQRLETRTRSCLQAMARHGTTTAEVKTGCGWDETSELKVLRALALLKREAVEVVPTCLLRLPAEGGEQELRKAVAWAAEELLPKIRRRKLAQFVDVAWSDSPEHASFLTECLSAAQKLGLPCKTHAECTNPAAAVKTAVEHLAASVDHLEYAKTSEVKLLAGSSTMATLLPCASLGNDRAVAPARELIEGGTPIALGSDFHSQHAPTLNMQTVVAVACLRMGLSPAEAICAATVNGAYALGRGDRTGSLEPGKQADVLVLNASDYREVAQRLGMNLVRLTLKRGEIIYREGEVTRREPGSISPKLPH